MKKIINILSYYILLFLGLIGTSWIIWSRFLRERVIKEIPDSLLTEYRFWILLYICCIYTFVIKSLIKENTSNSFVSSATAIINNLIMKPLITLDHAIKYNPYCKDIYEKFMIRMTIKWGLLPSKVIQIVIIIFDIIPRIILVTFLSIDVFHVYKIELFYKILLIGLLPFMFRYIKYSFTDFYEHLVKELTDNYDEVQVFEVGYRFDNSRKGNTDAVWHGEEVSVEDYIEILYDAFEDNTLNDVFYEYEGIPYCKGEVYTQYEKKFNKPVSSWTYEDTQETKKLFYKLIEPIIDLKFALRFFKYQKEKKIITRTKIVIFSTYLLCWLFVLLISYFHYPIELPMFKYLVHNIQIYLIIEQDPFIGNIYSINENLITIENVKNLIKAIFKLIVNMIIKIINYFIK